MNRFRRSVYNVVTACTLVAMVVFTSLSLVTRPVGAATAPPELSLNVLLIGSGATDPTTAAWESALTNEGVAYTEVTAAGTYGAETVTLPALTTGTIGNFNAVVIADSPAAFASGQLTALFSYESTDQVRQIDGYTAPYTGVGENSSSTTAVLDGTNGTLTAAGLAGLPGLAGTVPFSTGTNGYPATAVTGAPFTPWLDSSTGAVLAGVYQHPSTDAQAGVSELALNFDYNATMLQWELLAPGLINWVTADTHLGLERNYVEMDIDDTFTPDNAWSTALHDNDYSDANSLRMQPADVVTAANWEKANNFRMDQLFNYGGTDEYQAGELALPGDVAGPDPLLAEFQATDPTTGKSYANDFGWLSHTYDTPYLDVGCASQNYIEAELNQNTSEAAAAPGATAGTGGLGLTESTDTSNALGYENPQVFVPGNHSGFADLVPGTPATVDPPDLDTETVNTTGGTLAAGTYEYAVTDQFNAADSATVDQSQAYVTTPLTVPANGSVSLVWQAICHADNYLVYRAPVTGTTVGAWSQVGTLATPSSATLPDNSSGDPTSTTNVTGGGELELTYTDTGAAGTAQAAGWTPPVVENAQETPWEQNPYFIPALEAVGITTVGADASKAYPNPPTATFGTGDISGGTNTSYTGATYAAGVPFVDGTSEVAPRHPINIFYNASTETQEVDEYNTLYDSAAPDSQCKSTTTTTCSTTPFTFSDVVNQVVTGMLQNMLSNNPEPSYVHQTNLMGTPPAGAATTGTPPATPDTTGDGLLYSVLNPLLADYHTYFTTATPYEQPTLGAIGTVLADQTDWGTAVTAGSVKATEQNGVVTVTNSGTGAVNVPVTAPAGTTVGGVAYGQSYAGQLSTWTSVAAGGSLVLNENSAPTITSAASATSIVGAAFTATVTTTGAPAPTLTETGALPSGLTFVNNGNGTATISGTPAAGTGGSFPLVLTATNATGTTTQAFTLTNSEAPTVTSPATATFYTGANGTYTVTTTGFPAATITETGTLPAGLAFTAPSPATGSATISGTTTAAVGTSDTVTISATNSSGSTASLTLVITVAASGPPTITSGSTAYFNLGQTGSVAVTSTAGPAATLTETGPLPAGLTFTNELVAGAPSGTALISGTPTAGGVSSVTITAVNGMSPNATQTLSIQVDSKPAITSVAAATATAGKPFSFTVTAGGYPAPSLGWSGTLPPGLSFKDNGNGTATISGTPTGAWLADLGILATNAYGTVTNPFTLTVLSAPAPGTTLTTSLAGGGRLAATPDGLGYWVVGSNGSVTNYGSAVNYGSMAGKHLNQPIVGIAATPDGKGYWLVATDGGIFSFGDAQFYGSTGSIKLNKPIVGITSTLDGKGYWMVASDGGVFSFGDAAFHGSTGSIKLNQPVVGMSPTPSGKGYWLVASDGGIFTFGDAAFHGSTGSIRLNQPIMGMAPTRDGHGYWLVAGDGGIFTFGDASFHGSGGSSGNPAVGMIVSPTHAGYSLILANGARDNFGF